MIYVEGGSKRQREIVKDAAMFAWRYLMPRISNCVVDIEIKKGINDLLMNFEKPHSSSTLQMSRKEKYER